MEIDRTPSNSEAAGGHAGPPQWVGSRGGAIRGRGKTGCGEGVAEGAERLVLNGGKAACALTASSPWQLRGSFLRARLESLFLSVRWLEDAPERRGCGGGGGGGRNGSGSGVERRRRRRREGPGGVNSPEAAEAAGAEGRGSRPERRLRQGRPSRGSPG